MNLPPELMFYLFKFIPFQSIIRLRSVSKKWKTLIDAYKPESLTVITSDRYINHKLQCRFNKVSIRDEELFIYNLSLPKFRKIKSLSICIKGEYLINPTNFYNQFTELEELSFHHLHSIKEFNLNLKKLKSLKCTNDYYMNLNLNTPELCYLETDLSDSLNFNYEPDKLISLSVKYIGEEKGIQTILKLKNLERLIIINDCHINLYKRLLFRLSKLKEIHIYQMFYQVYDTHKEEYLNSLYDVNGINKISDVKIFINGFSIDHFNKIHNNEDYDSNHRYKLQNYTLKYLIDNYEKIDKIKCNYQLNYSELINLINKIPDDFCLKVQNIKEISILKYDEDEKKLLNFIECAKPNRLAIKGKCQKLSSSFFECLSQKCQFLNNIFIGKNQNLIENLESIVKLKNLKTLFLNHRISIDTLTKLIKSTNCYISGELDLTNHKTNPISFGYYLNYLDNFNWNNGKGKSYLCFYLKHTTESETPEFNDEDESNYYTDDQEFYICERIFLNDFKFNIIEFLLQTKAEFKNRLDKEDNNRQFMYFVEQFNYEQKLSKYVFSNMVKNKIIYIDKKLLF